VPGWLYLTGSPAELGRVWAAYGLAGPVPPGGSVTSNGDAAWVIDRRGQVREELNISPGPGTAASESSFAVLLADAARQFLQS
jgi:cytochrome oxidase Cu insertion factor (SCO1/SenC/PrrC family)